ncbi:uncharacterized protein LOC143541462 [Bidens hawaiensis]|uniref:uncharacterized protein LOC143541462 n=1 Tax=Bidens hawaiensis TaxID=980011 RepID=UPI004049493A
MATDLECGDQCFSDAEEEGSCFYSTYGDDPELIDCSVGDQSKDCRICHLSLVGGDAFELGCCCKNDLAAAHKHCAETWFKIKGNKTCEICNSIVTRGGGRGGFGGGGCINGHRLLNFILACLVFAFVISWLFHFNIPS